MFKSALDNAIQHNRLIKTYKILIDKKYSTKLIECLVLIESPKVKNKVHKYCIYNDVHVTNMSTLDL